MFEQSGQQGEGGRGAQGLLVSKGFRGGNRGDTEERNYFKGVGKWTNGEVQDTEMDRT